MHLAWNWLSACDTAINFHHFPISIVTIVSCMAITSCKTYDSSQIGHICRFNIRGGHPAAIRTTGSHVLYQLTPTETTNERRSLVRIESYQPEKSRNFLLFEPPLKISQREIAPSYSTVDSLR